MSPEEKKEYNQANKSMQAAEQQAVQFKKATSLAKNAYQTARARVAELKAKVVSTRAGFIAAQANVKATKRNLLNARKRVSGITRSVRRLGLIGSSSAPLVSASNGGVRREFRANTYAQVKLEKSRVRFNSARAQLKAAIHAQDVALNAFKAMKSKWLHAKQNLIRRGFAKLKRERESQFRRQRTHAGKKLKHKKHKKHGKKHHGKKHKKHHKKPRYLREEHSLKKAKKTTNDG